jgi:GntR family transcriptional regulator / MocR family aminotransferase
MAIQADLDRSGVWAAEDSRIMKEERPVSIDLRPRAKGKPLVCWLYEEIRAAILEGRLSSGSKLSSRGALALKYSVSLGTVHKAFDRLAKQGYVHSRVGKGTYVRPLLEARELPALPPLRLAQRVLSARGRLLASRPFPKFWSNRAVETFRLDRLALDAFPIETWKRLAADRLGRGVLDSMGEPLGLPSLRVAIADYVGGTRGVRCSAEQVVVTSGTQESLDLVARLLLDPGERVWMEDPGYPAVPSLLRAHGAKVIGVPVDAQGLNCDAGRERWPLARLAYVTPACQFPLGVPMSTERRLKLLEWANEAGAWIFEDDYDGQLQFDGRALAPLYSLDGESSVIYSSSFNRMTFPGLRLGFLILPPSLIEAAAAALSITQRYRPTFEQAVLADFIVQGHLQEHVRRMRQLYTVRREALIEAGRTELSGLMRFNSFQGGLHIVGWLDSCSDVDVYRCAAARRIDSVAMSSLTIDRRMPPGLVLGIAGADEDAIRTAIKRLGRLLRMLAWPTRRRLDASGEAHLRAATGSR